MAAAEWRTRTTADRPSGRRRTDGSSPNCRRRRFACSNPMSPEWTKTATWQRGTRTNHVGGGGGSSADVVRVVRVLDDGRPQRTSS